MEVDSSPPSDVAHDPTSERAPSHQTRVWDGDDTGDDHYFPTPFFAAAPDSRTSLFSFEDLPETLSRPPASGEEWSFPVHGVLHDLGQEYLEVREDPPLDASQQLVPLEASVLNTPSSPAAVPAPAVTVLPQKIVDGPAGNPPPTLKSHPSKGDYQSTPSLSYLCCNLKLA